MTASSESLADIHALLAQARERAPSSPQQAREGALRALRQAQLRGDAATLCDARLLAGEACSTLGQYAEALEHLEGAVAAASAARDASREAEAHRLVAATHDFVGNFDLAVQSHQQALRLHEGLGDDRGRAKLMRTIGVCVSKAGGFEEAIGWYRRSLETARRAGDEESAMRSLVNIGIDMKNLGRFEESLALYEEALAIAKAHGLDHFAAGIEGNMGNTLALLGRLDEADRCLTHALEIHRTSGAPHALQNDLVGLGRVRLRQGRLDEAQALLEEGLAVAQDNRFRPDLGSAHEALAELHKARGDAARALAHYEDFNAFTREILLDESKRRLKGVELRMRIEQSQREASRDRQKSLELEEAYDRLRASAAEKEELVAKLERQSREDPLTGLPNRADFERRLAAASREPRDGTTGTCLALVAIEGVKEAEEGAPEAWKEVARVLRAHLQPGHSLAHLGAGDFGVLMPASDVPAAQRAAQRLCAAVHAHDWAAVHPWIKPRATAGIAEVEAGGDPAGLVSEARVSVRDPRSPGRVRLASVPAEDRHGEDSATADPATLIHGEQVRASYANLPLTIGASFIAATLLCLVVRDVVALRTWGPWLAAMGTASVSFLFLCRAFQHRKPVGRAARRWGYYATAGCLALGSLWGVGDVLLHTPDSIDYQILVAVTAAIVASGAAFASATYLPPFYAFFLPASLPSAVILVNKEDATRVVTGLLVIFYLPVVTRFAIVVNRAFIESLRLRFQNIALVGELRAEKEAAESANVAKSRFLAAASHDLRQPMHALGLFLQSLRQGRLAERERGLVENINASYNAMEGLFDALLDISRLDAGVVEPRVRTFAVKRVLERLRNEYASQAVAKGLALSVRPCGAFVRSDPTLLEEIVGNFVSNAVRYTRSGRVVVGCRRVAGTLRIEVWDTGPGIPQDRQEDVFRDFVQLGNPERDRRQGLGLGLSIVQRLSRLLDHPIELRSVPGRGSVFRVTAPLGAAEDAEAPAEVEAPVLEPFEGRLIVVVDDDAAVVAAMQTLLAQWGCEVACADSGARILGKLATATRRPDLILCDYRLRGGENGAQVIADIRAEFNEDIAAALITGDTDPERLKEARESGLPLLHKPVKAPRLRALMAQLLGRSGAEEAT